MRFYDVVGYGGTVESAPGVWEDVVSELYYRGDVLRNTRRYSEGESVNDDLSVSNSISIVADDYALTHFFEIRYVRWSGTLWKVTTAEVKRPRLILRLGGVYNGPKDSTPATP
jgi:hypothetical protein